MTSKIILLFYFQHNDILYLSFSENYFKEIIIFQHCFSVYILSFILKQFQIFGNRMACHKSHLHVFCIKIFCDSGSHVKSLSFIQFVKINLFVFSFNLVCLISRNECCIFIGGKIASKLIMLICVD